jgi:nucleotide-binding universal stress UspA family protein
MRKILVATDFSDAAAAGLRLAAERHPDAELLLLHVVDDDFARRASQRTGLDPQELAEKAWNHADVRLEETAAAMRSRGRRVRPLLLRGDPVAMTVDAANRDAADCVIVGVDALAVGAPGGRFRTRLVRRCPCPVLFVFAD